MNIMKAINAPSCEEIVTIEEHVKSSELFKKVDSVQVFDYELNDKSAKNKLIKAAKRPPIEVEDNSSSSNMIFSAGAWFEAMLPAVKYWNEVKGEKSCQIGDYTLHSQGQWSETGERKYWQACEHTGCLLRRQK